MSTHIHSWCGVIAAGLEFDLSDEASKKRLDNASLFVTTKLQSSPWIVRFGISALYSSMGIWVLFTKGRAINQLADNEKRALYYDLKCSRIGVKRDFLKFFESFVTLHWFHQN